MGMQVMHPPPQAFHTPDHARVEDASNGEGLRGLERADGSNRDSERTRDVEDDAPKSG